MPHFLVILSALAYPQGGHRSQLACLLVLAATLAELHVQQPFCSALSGAAAWSMLEEFHLLLRIFAAICAWIWPAFPLDNGAPSRGERSAASAGHSACQVGPSGRSSSRTPRSSRLGSTLDLCSGAEPQRSLTQALEVTDVDMGEVPADTIMRGADAGPEDLRLLFGTFGRQPGCQMASLRRSGASLPRFVRNSVPTNAPRAVPLAGHRGQCPSCSSSVHPVPQPMGIWPGE